MRTLSRHLPPLHVEDGRMPLLGKLILLGIFAAVAYWFYSSPITAGLVLGGLFVWITASTIHERRRTTKFRQERDDTICEFRRSFDVRQVDPWIIRATYEAFGAWFDAKQPTFPLRASDSIEDDLNIDWEDVDDLAHEVAQRAGYDISDCEANPLFGKVKTLNDFVIFFTHQPRTRQAEQGGGGQAATQSRQAKD